jgi:dTDP-4-amino-4,6-dideoxygalactose transaminase
MCAHREATYGREPWSCGGGRPACGCPAGSCRALRESEAAQVRAIILPLFPQLTEAEQDTVVAALRAACRE